MSEVDVLLLFVGFAPSLADGLITGIDVERAFISGAFAIVAPQLLGLRFISHSFSF